MINFIDKKTGKKNKSYFVILVSLVALIVILTSQTNNLNTEKEEVEENKGFQVFLPIDRQFKNKNVQIIEYKQNNDFLIVSLLGKDLDEIKNFNDFFLKGLKISEVVKKDNNLYWAKAEGKVSPFIVLENKTRDKEGLRENMGEDFFFQDGTLVQGIDLISYIRKEERKEVSLRGEIDNLIKCFQEYSKNESYENLEFILEIIDKELYLLTFTGSL